MAMEVVDSKRQNNVYIRYAITQNTLKKQKLASWHTTTSLII